MAPKQYSISLNWLRRNLFARLKSRAEDPTKVVQEFEQYLEATFTHQLEHISASTLDDDSAVISMLNLSYNPDRSIWNLEDKHIYSPSKLLRELGYVTGRSASNEAYIRCALNLILVSCIGEEKRRAGNIHARDQRTQASFQPPPRPTTPDPPEPVLLKFETELCHPVEVQGRRKMLVGKADYTLWYNAQETMGTNLIVLEAKRKHYAGTAVPQLIAYMGIVHRQRKLAGKTNAVVYGIASDSSEFRFWRIDNDSELRKSHVYDWECHATDIVSFIRFIIRAAILESPSTTPYSGEKKKSTLAAYKSNTEDSFDFVTLPGDFSYEEVDDPPDMEY
ncbi:hypothetical protein TEQG_05951 [Trichophyton equinum CBS 127.97]|uniref:Uncharacterized protein n=1 Tax=Trichophyton equinum (strain ATCC MYA-4606 / CBS 127.97) TaxID=559882 RepID=F2PYD0_TRIEC|nr:hypothetical protein TEQG_05951 [Trichophyton equinum CBS 127.97]